MTWKYNNQHQHLDWCMVSFSRDVTICLRFFFRVPGCKNSCHPWWAFFLSLEVKILLLVLVLLVYFHTFMIRKIYLCNQENFPTKNIASRVLFVSTFLLIDKLPSFHMYMLILCWLLPQTV